MAGGVHVRELKYLRRTDGLQKFEHSLLSCSCGGTVLCCGWVQLARADSGGWSGCGTLSVPASPLSIQADGQSFHCNK